jgi:hypothetical protein
MEENDSILDALPTGSEECQAAGIPPSWLKWVKWYLGEKSHGGATHPWMVTGLMEFYPNPMKTCCKWCHAWYDSGMPHDDTQEFLAYQKWLKGQFGHLLYTGKSQASPAQSPGPQPSGGPQTISRPLDLRKGATIRLTEAEAQLAMSPAPAGGGGSLGLGKSSVGGGYATASTLHPAYIGPKKKPAKSVPTCLGKSLTATTYQSAQKKAQKIQAGNWPTAETHWGFQEVTQQEWLDKFAIYKKAWLTWLELSGAAPTPADAPSEPPF